MLNKRHEHRTKNGLLLVAIVVALSGISRLAHADLETLFTTPQERRIINTNRYKTKDVVKSRVQPVQSAQAEIISPLLQEEVNMSFVISGITISNSGPHSVWINNEVYEDGDHLEDNSRIKVITDKNIRVRITTPDGKRYYGTSGEIVEVTYMAAVEN